MKHIVLLFASLVCITACNSWKSVPDKLDTLVTKAEQSSAKYSEKDWEKNKQTYQELIDEYYEHRDLYPLEQRISVVKSIGRYHALLLVNGIEESASLLNSIKEIIPSYLNGIDEVVKENGSGILDRLRGLFDSGEVEDAIETLTDDLEDLIDDFSETMEDSLGNF